MDVRVNYTSPTELRPGLDPTIDRACGFLMEGKALFDAPTDAERTRSTADEDAFFAELERSPEPLRDLHYEQQIERAQRLNRLGRTVQRALQALPFGSGRVLSGAGKLVHRRILGRVERLE